MCVCMCVHAPTCELHVMEGTSMWLPSSQDVNILLFSALTRF